MGQSNSDNAHVSVSAVDLAVLVPSALIVLTIFYDITSAIRFPAWLKRVYEWLVSPFRNFLSLEDLEEATPSVLKQKAVTKPTKLNSLICLSFMQAVLAVAWTFVAVHNDESRWKLTNIALVLAWVSQSLSRREAQLLTCTFP